MKTYAVKASEIERSWWVVDATDQTLGRLATRIATLLEGKHKPIYSPHLDTGDHVVVVNAAKIRVTGDKLRQKSYFRHSGYPGGLREESLGTLLQRKPELVIEREPSAASKVRRFCSCSCSNATNRPMYSAGASSL